MKKLISTFMIVAMGVLLASCGGGNAASSGSSSNPGSISGSYDNTCLQTISNYISNYAVRDYYGNELDYRVEVDYQIKEIEMKTGSKCLVGDYLCGDYSYSDVANTDSGEKTVYKDEQNSALFAILNKADRCSNQNSYIYEIIDGNVMYHINVSIPPEANPVRVFERYDDNSYDDYYVSKWKVIKG